MFFYEEKADKKPKDVAKRLNTTSEKISEWAKDLEKYNIITFSKTAFGSLLFKESDVKVLKEYGLIKTTIGNTRDAIDILKETGILIVEEENMDWAKKLKFAVWRRH